MAGEAAQRLRTAPELATLLLELGRLIRARRYYPAGDRRLAGVFERSLRAWRADLGRRGTLDIELVPEGFRESGARGVLFHPQLTELQQDLAERGVHRLRFDADLDGETFAAFAEVLATDAGRTASRGGFAAALYAHTPTGIVVNGALPDAPSPAAPEQAPEREPEPDAPTLPLDLPDHFEELDVGPEALSISAALSSTDDVGGTPAPSHDLDVLLRQLDECTSVGQYQDLARRVTLLAERAFDEGRPDECFRVAVRLTAQTHAKDSSRLRVLAENFLRSLMQGARLEDLVLRAARALDDGDLEASQVLLALGEAAVPALLDGVVALENNAERERLTAVVVTLVEPALPAVIERLRSGAAPARLRAAARIAGELQHPDLVAPLADLLGAEDRGVREEAVRALVRIGSEPAVNALASALDRDAPGLALAALHGLGSTGSAQAVPYLERALARALEARDVARAKEAIRALGRLGRPEAALALVGLLERRVRLGGGWLRELKAAAVSALAAVPGDEAVAALAQAAQARDTQLRRAAQTALDRRAQARARVGA
jgi:HEAT repeat protein